MEVGFQSYGDNRRVASYRTTIEGNDALVYLIKKTDGGYVAFVDVYGHGTATIIRYDMQELVQGICDFVAHPHDDITMDFGDEDDDEDEDEDEEDEDDEEDCDCDDCVEKDFAMASKRVESNEQHKRIQELKAKVAEMKKNPNYEEVRKRILAMIGVDDEDEDEEKDEPEQKPAPRRGRPKKGTKR